LHIRNRFAVNLLLALTVLLASATYAAAETSSVIISKTEGYAVYGTTETISTVLQLTTPRPMAGFAHVADRDIEIASDASMFIPFGPKLGGPAVGAQRISLGNAEGSTFVTFKSPTGLRITGYEIPILTQRVGENEGETEIRMLTNPADGTFGTSLLLFNVSDARGWITATIYDDAQPGRIAVREYILTDPHGALTWYDVHTKFDSGRIELTRGMVGGFGCLGCGTADEVYGFAAIGTANGDAPRVRPLVRKELAAMILP
jgi:hypothetical protein